MKNFFLYWVVITTIAFGQSMTVQQVSELAGWSNAGLDSETFMRQAVRIDIADKYRNVSDYYPVIFNEISASGETPVIFYFSEGTYNFGKSLDIPSNIMIMGEGAGKTIFVFDLNSEVTSVIKFIGSPERTVDYKLNIKAGDNFILTEACDLNLKKGDIVKIFQGTNEWGKSSSGKKKFEKGQILKVKGVLGKKIIFDSNILLDYRQKTSSGDVLKIMQINAIQNSGVQNLALIRKDQPSAGSNATLHFDYSFNCLVSGVESNKAANNHLFLRNSLNCEVSGSFFNDTYDTGGGGNGYGVSVGNCSSGNLIIDNIFNGLRHSIIFATAANANVVYGNASFNKPMGNFDEGSISLHGHYPYMNLFEANYVEFICVDFVWGENGPWNTFFRNVVYDDGLFGFMNSKEIEIERGNNNNTFVIGNIANLENKGNSVVAENLSPSQQSRGITSSVVSFYGAKSSAIPYHSLAGGKFLEIPAKERFNSNNKTVRRKNPEPTGAKVNSKATE